MDDLASVFTSIDNKAKVMAGFCVAVLVHLFSENFFDAVVASSILWWMKIVASILAIGCLVVTVYFCYVVLRVSGFAPKGLPLSDISRSEEGAQSEQSSIEHKIILGDDLRTMLKSLAENYDERIQLNHLVLDEKGKNLEKAQKFLWPGLILSLIAALIAVAVRMTKGAASCPF